MATEPDTAETLRRQGWFTLKEIKGRAFEAVLLAATLVGLVALVVLVVIAGAAYYFTRQNG